MSSSTATATTLPAGPWVPSFCRWPLGLLLGFVLLLVACLSSSAGEDVEEALAARLAAIAAEPVALVRGHPLAAADLIAELYAYRGYRPIWLETTHRQTLLAEILASAEDGLEPEDFHASAIAGLPGELEDSQQAAESDLLMTDALLRLLYQLYFGKLDPKVLDPVWNFARPALNGDVVGVIEPYLDRGDIASLVAAARPRTAIYALLRGALARYRAITDAGGWPTVPAGPTLKPGMTDPRMPLLRRRLAVEGYPVGSASDEPAFLDPVLEDAVRHFQGRHGLGVDGLVGPRTLAALNVPVSDRIDQLRVNLERARWVAHDTPADLILVDIAGFSAEHVQGGTVVWSSRAIVGRSYRQTPVFADEIEYIVFNPTWTVPRSLLVQDILPQIRAHPGYLAEQGFDVIDRQGRPVALDTAIAAALAGDGFPYTLIQRPGPLNALGRVKFMFPNEHAVYLHDTPQRRLFLEAQRSFSSGCIRVDDSLGLAERLLAAKPGWDRARIDAVLASGETTTVFLDRPIPVLLHYRTVMPSSDGGVRFLDDIYGRDARVLAALDEPFRPTFPPR